MTIKVGDKLPNVTVTQATAEGPKPVSTEEFFKGRKVALFAVPGAFTPTCSAKHLPGFKQLAQDIKGKGVDVIACLSVNDPFVMKSWGEEHGALGKVVMLADGNAELTKELGIEVDLTKALMGLRARRGVLTIEDGTVTRVDLEEPGKLEVSGAEHCLMRL